jgi:hypothetical protein
LVVHSSYSTRELEMVGYCNSDVLTSPNVLYIVEGGLKQVLTIFCIVPILVLQLFDAFGLSRWPKPVAMVSWWMRAIIMDVIYSGSL